MKKNNTRERDWIAKERLHHAVGMLDAFLDTNKGIDPVVIVADCRDHHGRQAVIFGYRVNGMSEENAERAVDKIVAEYADKAIPTVTMVVSMNDAEIMLPHTSPTAMETLRKWKTLRKAGDYLMVVIAARGNRYQTISVPEAPKDGQNQLKPSMN